MDVRLVVEKGARRSHVFRMRSSEMMIGRKKHCGVRIPSGSVSRQHCRLRQINGFLIVEDLESANGTFLNGRRVAGRETVRPGDRLRIGPVTFVVEYELTPAAMNSLAEYDDGSGILEIVDEETPTFYEHEAVSPSQSKVDPALPLSMEDSDSDMALPLIPEEDDSSEMAGDMSLHLPEADELRNLLSQLENIDEED